jgi:hypothetical protein
LTGQGPDANCLLVQDELASRPVFLSGIFLFGLFLSGVFLFGRFLFGVLRPKKANEPAVKSTFYWASSN